MLLAEKSENLREWKAELELTFSSRIDKTVLSHRQHLGPLVVQRPFYPEGGVCHVYIIHPPGGVVGGDKLKLNVNLESSTHVLITTPSAGKFYRSGLLLGKQVQHLRVEENSLLEWFPQENIFFNGCNSELETIVNLSAGSKFCGWEINCLGRPAANEKYDAGSVSQVIRVYRNNKPLLLERNKISGADKLLASRCGLNGQSVFATMVATDIDDKTCEQLQDVFHGRSENNISITLINDLLVCRYLGNSAEIAKQHFSVIWEHVRKKQKQISICKPRIWST